MKKVLLCLMMSAFVAASIASCNTVRSETSELPEGDLTFETAIEREIWQVATEVVRSNDEVRRKYYAELLEIYEEAVGKDFVVFFFEGGWGSRSLEINDEGRSIVEGIVDWLDEAGYSYCIGDYPRTKDAFGDYLYDIKEFTSGFPVKSKRTAAKIDFLNKRVDGLQILLVGKSTGAVLIGKVVGKVEETEDVYVIEVGSPLGPELPIVGRSLAISDNGNENDVMVEKDFLTAIRANRVMAFFVNYTPAFTPVDWLISRVVITIILANTDAAPVVPGHLYMWEYPGVGGRIETFLDTHFGEDS